MRYFLYALLAFFVGAVLVFLYELIGLYLEQWFDVDWTGTSAADWEDFDGLHAVDDGPMFKNHNVTFYHMRPDTQAETRGNGHVQ